MCSNVEFIVKGIKYIGEKHAYEFVNTQRSENNTTVMTYSLNLVFIEHSDAI